MTPPFERTICDCEEDKAHCRSIPGVLLPDDILIIREFLEKRDQIDYPAFLNLFRLGPKGWKAARITEGGIESLHLPTITPKIDKDDRCVFLTDEDRCSIHAVAPFGCAYFDAHMSAKEGQRRSLWGFEILLRSRDYQELAVSLALQSEKTKEK